jgi:hypothetical protein
MIKKNLLTTLVFILFNVSLTFSQYNVIGLDALGLFNGYFKASYERSFSKHLSFAINYENAEYASGTTGSLNSQTKVYSLTGWGIIPEARFYPLTKKKQAPRGFFLGLHYRYRELSENYTGKDFSTMQASLFSSPTAPSPNLDITTKATASNYGLTIGYKFNAGPIILEPLFGFGSGSGKYEQPNERSKIDPFYKDDQAILEDALRAQIKVGFYFPQMKPHEEIIENPAYEIDKSLAADSMIMFKIYRPGKLIGLVMAYNVFINEEKVARMSNSSYEMVKLPYSDYAKITASTEDQVSLQVPLVPGGIYYLECKIGMGLLVGRPKMKIVDPATGQEAIDKIKH